MASKNNQNFLRTRSLDESQLREVLERTDQLKNRHLDLCRNTTLVLLFEKPSTRTRVSFSRGFQELGGETLFLGSNEVQLSRGETVADTARTLSRYVDAIACRTYEQQRVEQLARAFDGPVINALTDRFHPCQTLSDIYTVFEHAEKEDPVLAYVGDGNNVCHSLMEVCSVFNVKLRVATPEDYQPNEDLTRQLRDENARLTLVKNPEDAVQGADFVYTDVWVSMGDDEDTEEINNAFRPYQVNAELLSQASKNVKVMHCLPAHRGEEITGEVMDGPRSIVFDQAENRLHVQKALVAYLMAGPERLRDISFS